MNSMSLTLQEFPLSSLSRQFGPYKTYNSVYKSHLARFYLLIDPCRFPSCCMTIVDFVVDRKFSHLEMVCTHC